MTTSMPFGRYKGLSVGDLPDDYLTWLYGLDDLREPLRSAVERELRSRTPTASKHDEVTIHLKPEQLPLARRAFDLGFRTMAKSLHPDHGGNPAQMRELNLLVRQVREQLGAIGSAR